MSSNMIHLTYYMLVLMVSHIHVLRIFDFYFILYTTQSLVKPDIFHYKTNEITICWFHFIQFYTYNRRTILYKTNVISYIQFTILYIYHIQFYIYTIQLCTILYIREELDFFLNAIMRGLQLCIIDLKSLAIVFIE